MITGPSNEHNNTFPDAGVCKLEICASNTLGTVKSSHGRICGCSTFPGILNLGLQDTSKDKHKTVLTMQAIYKLDPYKSLCI